MPSDIRARRVYTSSVPYLHVQESRSTSRSLPARQGAPGSAQVLLVSAGPWQIGAGSPTNPAAIR